MKTVCDEKECTGCMACMSICPKKAIHVEDKITTYASIIDEDKCIGCNACYGVCQKNNEVKLQQPILWYQGWAKDENIRRKASSGGFATAISHAFIENGGYVCSCTYHLDDFIFKTTNDIRDLDMFSGSKYVKSNPLEVYVEVKKYLSEGEKVLFIGLPCQVAALLKYIPSKLHNELYVIDLICHGTPSPKLLKNYLLQCKVDNKQFKNITFRDKAKFQIIIEGVNTFCRGVTDEYSIAFLNSMIYTDNCYQCNYADEKRVADLTLGDSWGSKLEIEEARKGISLALVQTEKGRKLLNESNLMLHKVDIQNAIAHNAQLVSPSIKPLMRDRFIDKYSSGKKISSLVRKYCPKDYYKQKLKRILLKLNILH